MAFPTRGYEAIIVPCGGKGRYLKNMAFLAAARRHGYSPGNYRLAVFGAGCGRCYTAHSRLEAVQMCRQAGLKRAGRFACVTFG